MKNRWLPLLVLILLISVVGADSGIEVKGVPKENIVVSDFGNNATYDLIINNTGDANSFKVFTLVGVMISPLDYFELPPGISKISITAELSDKLLRERKGLLLFEYQIKELNGELFKDRLPVYIVDLENILDFEYSPINPEDSKTEITIRNKENVDLDNLTIVFDSVFFRESYTFDLPRNTSRQFSVVLNKEGKDKLVAGPYLVSATILTPKGDKQIGGLIDYLEKEGTSVYEDNKGWIIRHKTISKTNFGNTQVSAVINMRRDVFSRLFTTNSEEPSSVTRNGFFVDYTWQKTIAPGESFEVRQSTNYTMPFLILIVIVVLGYFASMLYVGIVSVKKTVTLVRTRGGEFALKVTLRVRARKSVDKVQLTDILPGMTKLFENFGKKPDQIDHNSRRVIWHIGALASGEERVYSYVVYSKLNVVGRFELPTATASYELNGQKKFSYSNRAFFAAEKS